MYAAAVAIATISIDETEVLAMVYGRILPFVAYFSSFLLGSAFSWFFPHHLRFSICKLDSRVKGTDDEHKSKAKAENKGCKA